MIFLKFGIKNTKFIVKRVLKKNKYLTIIPVAAVMVAVGIIFF